MTRRTEKADEHHDGADAGTRHRVVLRLLDHQVLGPDGEMLGNVDDLDMLVSDHGWFVTGLAVGPGALGRRLPGRIGAWMIAIWRRLHVGDDHAPAVVPISQVTDIGAALEVDRDAAEQLTASFGFERWLREYVISRIPGAKGGGDDRDHGAATDPADTGVATVPGKQEGARYSLGSLLQARVEDEDGTPLGRVHEVVGVELGTTPRDRLRITHLEYGHRDVGSELGYNEDAGQGPLLVGLVIRWWQRGSRVAPVEDVSTVDLEEGRITVTGHRDHVHPHEL